MILKSHTKPSEPEAANLYNVCSAGKLTKGSSNTALHLVSFSAEHTYVIQALAVDFPTSIFTKISTVFQMAVL